MATLFPPYGYLPTITRTIGRHHPYSLNPLKRGQTHYTLVMCILLSWSPPTPPIQRALGVTGDSTPMGHVLCVRCCHASLLEPGASNAPPGSSCYLSLVVLPQAPNSLACPHGHRLSPFHFSLPSPSHLSSLTILRIFPPMHRIVYPPFSASPCLLRASRSRALGI